MSNLQNTLSQPVGILGSGAAALITGHALLRDGFTSVQLLTRDASPGGVWAKSRVYPGLRINNAQGEFRFSALPQPRGSAPGGRITGQDMQTYMESFTDRFLGGHIKYNTEILHISRKPEDELPWVVEVLDKPSGEKRTYRYARIVLCTGGCSEPYVPNVLSPKAAELEQLDVPVVHSQHFAPEIENIIRTAKSASPEKTVVVIGGGKSAQDISSYLTRQGVRVKVVFEKTDAILSGPFPIPPYVRKSRLMSVFSPHITLNTRLERFLHTTWLGSKIVKGFWDYLEYLGYYGVSVPPGSPLRNSQSLFWSVRSNDEGVPQPVDSFFSLVSERRIDLVAPARAAGYKSNGRVILEDGRELLASVVILCTGYQSSWTSIFDDTVADDIGLTRHVPSTLSISKQKQWNHYKSLENPPPSHEAGDLWASSIYRGLVPAKSIDRYDFAINGAMFSINNGYTFEVAAHWISSYFLKDPFLLKNLPATPADAFAQTEIVSAWLRRRYPDLLLWVNESYSSQVLCCTWPQYVDELLTDMSLPAMRSGGNWLNWVFKVIQPNEIEHLAEERAALRRST